MARLARAKGSMERTVSRQYARARATLADEASSPVPSCSSGSPDVAARTRPL
jgi:hypothetical protein